jgi:hypothetical protein
MRGKIWQEKTTKFLISCALAMLIAFPAILSAAMMEDPGARELRELRGYLKPTETGIPNTQLRVHKVGNMLMAITNWGFFGSQIDEGFRDPETGELAPSCEFPAGSGIEYLFQGALWIGAIVEDDTLVSVGADGWQHVNEMYPAAIPDGDIEKRSIRPNDPAYHPDAISEADYIAEYTDTLTDQSYVASTPMDRRPHIPLNLRIKQKSYSWSYKYAEDFILFDFLIYNIGVKSLRKIYMGIYIDADVLHPEAFPNGFADDICGFKWTYTRESDNLEDTIRIAWIADNDGDPAAGAFNYASPVGVTGTRVVRTPNPELRYSFNWWVSEQYDPAKYDWGPMMDDNYRDYGTGGLGTPEGDKNKYYIMSNNEFDYDQIYSAIDFSSEGWLPPPAADLASRLARGYDTRYLISFGPFNIEPGDSLPVTLAYVAGDNFHNKPDDFSGFSITEPDEFYDKLVFTDLGLNATWAAWVYDNPGIDTDGDLDSGRCRPVVDTIIEGDDTTIVEDCIYYEGDGVPDFDGPPPPPAPYLRYTTLPGEITIRWNGLETERFSDPFSGFEDFEGYRVYMGREMKMDEFALLTSHDIVDYNRYYWDVGKRKWFLTGIPMTPQELQDLYGEDFDPTNYSESNPYTAENGTRYYFEKVDWNQFFDDPRGIRKVYRDEIAAGEVTADTGIDLYPENYVEINDTMYHKFYEYEFSIDGLIHSQPVFLSVTAFDFGNPENALEPLESSPLTNAIKVFPIYSADQVVQNDAEVKVYPNPYRIDAGYAEDRFEDPQRTGRTEWERRIHFINLPEECTIKIWTTDGDLVREIEHYPGGQFSETNSKAYWDMITRNTQAIVSGIYIYSIESDQGTQLGKIVVIK